MKTAKFIIEVIKVVATALAALLGSYYSDSLTLIN